MNSSLTRFCTDVFTLPDMCTNLIVQIYDMGKLFVQVSYDGTKAVFEPDTMLNDSKEDCLYYHLSFCVEPKVVCIYRTADNSPHLSYMSYIAVETRLRRSEDYIIVFTLPFFQSCLPAIFDPPKLIRQIGYYKTHPVS